MNQDYSRKNEGRRDGFASYNGRAGGEGHGEGSYSGSRQRFSRTASPVGTSRSYNSRDRRVEDGEHRSHSSNGYSRDYSMRDNYRSQNEYRGGKSRYSGGSGYDSRPRQDGFRSKYNSDRRAHNDEMGGAQLSRPNRYARSYNDNGGYRQGGDFRPRENRGTNYRYGDNEAYSQGRPTYNRNAKPRNTYSNYSQKKRLEYKEENYDPTVPIRLNKYLANAGVCSRRDADKYIEAGVVTVNGTVVNELGAKVYRTDEVKFHDTIVKIEKKVYVLLNKPKGYVTTSEDPQNRKTVMDLVAKACPERIYPVGRLDRNTTGVLLFTNDGEMASKLTHPKFLKKKIYHVTTDQNVSASDLRKIAEGVVLEDGEIRADQIEYASPTDKNQIGIEIHSGKNRIVRRIFESLGYHVVKLDRVYFAGLTKKNLRRGDWRYLTEREVNMLRMGAFE